MRRFRGSAGGSINFLIAAKTTLNLSSYLILHRAYLLQQIYMAQGNRAKIYKCPHDRDIDLHCPFAVEHGRQHRHTLFGEYVRHEAAAAATSV